MLEQHYRLTHVANIHEIIQETVHRTEKWNSFKLFILKFEFISH